MATARTGEGREHGRETIAVTVTLIADLRRFAPPGVAGPHRRTVPSGSTVADLLDALGIPAGTDLTVGLDGELAERGDALRDGAEVVLLGPMEGG
jgi:sulfur carrier protein ThiS